VHVAGLGGGFQVSGPVDRPWLDFVDGFSRKEMALAHQELHTTRWRKSSRCNSGACVEIADLGDLRAVRDSKDPHGPVLTFGAVAWSAFIVEIGRGGLAAS